MELSLLEIWNSMGLLARTVAVGLIAMGFASLVVAVERIMVLRRAEIQSGAFAAKAGALLSDQKWGEVLTLAHRREFAKVPLPRLLAFGLAAHASVDANDTLGPVELARRELVRKLEVLASELRRGTGILASTGSTAPFIGLFGTVIGIITAFQGIAASGGGGIAAVSAGIAEALIVTAVGLIVAIFAVLVFNYLTTRFDRFDMGMQHAASELVDRLEGARAH